MASVTFLAMLVLSIMFVLSAATPTRTKSSITTNVVLSTTTVPVSVTSTSTSSAPISSKTSIPDCNYEAWPSTIILPYMITELYAAAAIDCQTFCEQSINSTTGLSYPEPCLSYSFVPGTYVGYPSCELYSVPFTGHADGADYVIKEPFCNMFFSDRFPQDGSGFCYSE